MSSPRGPIFLIVALPSSLMVSARRAFRADHYHLSSLGTKVRAFLVLVTLAQTDSPSASENCIPLHRLVHSTTNSVSETSILQVQALNPHLLYVVLSLPSMVSHCRPSRSLYAWISAQIPKDTLMTLSILASVTGGQAQNRFVQSPCPTVSHSNAFVRWTSSWTSSLKQ